MSINQHGVPPCPFCGSVEAPIPEECPYLETWSVLCDRHAGGCGARSGYHPFQDQAIQAWTMRPDNRKPTIEVSL